MLKSGKNIYVHIHPRISCPLNFALRSMWPDIYKELSYF